MTMQFYNTRLSCCNCGMRDVYLVPQRAEIMPYRDEDEMEGERELSYYTRDPDDSSDYHELNCHNCGLPFLYVIEWDSPELAKLSVKKDTKS